MDPQQQNPVGHEVPLAQPNANMIASLHSAEAHGVATEVAPVIGAGAPAANPTQTPGSPTQPAPVFQSGPLPAAQAGPIAPPAVADDLDLIEKEWVEKAKAIVVQTRSDPYNQNKEINRFKADYMQKRYGKEIKLEDK